MRLEATKKSDEYNVWLTDADLDRLSRAAASHHDDLILQLDGYVGLRAFEIPQICPKHVKRTRERLVESRAGDNWESVERGEFDDVGEPADISHLA